MTPTPTPDQVHWKYRALVLRVGRGFHPDTPYDGYEPPITGIISREEFEAVMDGIFEADGPDPYERGLELFELPTRDLTFKEEVVYASLLRNMARGIDGPRAWQRCRDSADATASLLGTRAVLGPSFWDWLKQQAGIDPEAACCPICGGVTSPAGHAACLAQLGEWPARGTRYNDDV